MLSNNLWLVLRCWFAPCALRANWNLLELMTRVSKSNFNLPVFDNISNVSDQQTRRPDILSIAPTLTRFTVNNILTMIGHKYQMIYCGLLVEYWININEKVILHHKASQHYQFFILWMKNPPRDHSKPLKGFNLTKGGKFMHHYIITHNNNNIK